MPFKPFFLAIGLTSLLTTFSGCSHRDSAFHAGRDPSVFRVNLDFMPRVLVFALSDELWAAYDVEYSRLYKTWKGGISFNGPMYDDRHNVQSSTRGITYSADTSRRSPWFIKVNGRQETVKPEYLGYTLHGTNATVHYRIKRPRSLCITESNARDPPIY
jgi:hypothetical protein